MSVPESIEGEPARSLCCEEPMRAPAHSTVSPSRSPPRSRDSASSSHLTASAAVMYLPSSSRMSSRTRVCRPRERFSRMFSYGDEGR